MRYTINMVSWARGHDSVFSSMSLVVSEPVWLSGKALGW